MHPLCRPESTRDHLRGRKQDPSLAMHSLRGRQRPGDRRQSPTPLVSKTKASPNAHLRNAIGGRRTTPMALALTGQDIDSEGRQPGVKSILALYAGGLARIW